MKAITNFFELIQFFMSPKNEQEGRECGAAHTQAMSPISAMAVSRDNYIISFICEKVAFCRFGYDILNTPACRAIVYKKGKKWGPIQPQMQNLLSENSLVK